jgi:hypothetical protein
MLSNGRRYLRWLPYALAVVLALPPGAGAQTPPAAPQTAPVPQPATIRSLKVRALAGEQAMNDLEGKVMAPLVVQVSDQSDQPIEGVDVIFRFPLEGPSASFPDHKNVQTVRTNADGQAAALGWMANGKVGTFQIQVTASRGNEQGSATISMTNVTRITDEGKTHQKKWWSSRWGKVAIIAGAAGITAAIVLATRGGGSSGPKVVTATPGSPTIGGPQ